MDWISLILILAQEGAAEGAGGGQGPEGSFRNFLIPVMLVFMAFYFIVMMPQKREQEKRSKMLEGIKETDRVVTSGGMYGVVTNVQRDAGRVTLRVDDNTGTKIKVSLAAIAQVLGDDDAEGKK